MVVNGGVLEASDWDSGSGHGLCLRGAISNDVPAWIRARPRPHFPSRFTAGTVGTGPKAFGGKLGAACRSQPAGCPGSGPDGQISRARITSGLAAAARLSLSSRSATPPTRLETRTKESNTSASHWVV